MNCYILLFCFLGFISLLSGCSGGYNKIDFCWTSDNYLSPEDRITSIDSSLDQTLVLITDWIEKEKDGVIVSSDANSYKKVEILDNAKENFDLAKQITEKKWLDYKKNSGRSWANGEFAYLQKLTNNQVEFTDGSTQGYCIKAKLDKRQAHVKYRVQTGTRMQSTYSPGFTTYSSSHGGIKSTNIPGHMISTPVPVYETRTKTLDFYSMMYIYFYLKDQKVEVYVTACPYSEADSIDAGFGNSIGYAFRDYVKGEKEAGMVKELLDYLNANNR